MPDRAVEPDRLTSQAKAGPISNVVCPGCKRSLDDVIESLIRQRGKFKGQREKARTEVERLQRLLWECHCAASDGIPVPFDRWLADGGPEGMPADVRELRDAYDTVSEQLDEALNGGTDGR